jgi:hypothetical protein
LFASTSSSLSRMVPQIAIAVPASVTPRSAQMRT